MVLILRTMLRTMIYNFWYRHFTKSLNLQERLCDAFLSYESFLVINFTHPTKNHSQSPHSFDIIGSLVTPPPPTPPPANERWVLLQYVHRNDLPVEYLPMQEGLFLFLS